MDKLGHYEQEIFGPNESIVRGCRIAFVERLSDTEITVSLWRPGQDDVQFRLCSASRIELSHSFTPKTDAEIKETRFEILPCEDGGFFVVDHWRDDPYQIFPTYSDAVEFAARRAGNLV